MIPLKVLGDRVLVRPDVLSNAPEAHTSGLVLAKSLAAAVTGEDATTSLCRGTVIAVGQPRHPLKEEAEALADRLSRFAESQAAGSYRLPEPFATALSATFSDLLHDAAHLLCDLVRKHPCCAIGDDVLFAYDAGQAITLDDDTYILMREADLLAIVTPELEPA